MSRLAEVRAWVLFGLLVCAAAAALAAAASAQDKPQDKAQDKAQDGEKAGRGLHAVVTSGGVRRYGAGRWGVADLAVSNQGSQEAETLVSAFFVDWTGRVTSGQFARRVWVPAESRRHTWLPFQAPEQLPMLVNGVWRLESRAVLVGAGGQLLRDDATQALHSRTLLAPMGFPHPTGVIVPEDDEDNAAVMAVVAEARRGAEIDEAVVMLHQRRLPSLPLWLDSLDVVVLGGDERLADDFGGLQSLRRWVRGGGQLWVMRDRVSAKTMDLLFGDDLPLLAVGRESLPAVQVTPGRWEEFSGHSVQLDPPAQLVQVLEHDGLTLAEVDGWPAAVRRRLGDGAVLVTLLSAKGWLDARGKCTKALARLGGELYDMPPRDPWPAEVARAQLQARIGYRVPPKWAVLSALLAYCLALLGSGVALARRGRLERLWWLAPALALLTTAALTTVGYAYRHAPLTVGRLQLVRAAAGSGEAEVRSEATVYSPTQLAERLSGEGAAQRPMSRSVRMVWTDENQWQQEGRPLRPGARTFSTRSTIEPFHAQATARLTERGLEGQLHGKDLPDLEQAIIAAPRSASLAVRWGQQRRFTAGQQDVLAPGVHTPAHLLSEEDRRRQELLQALLDQGGAEVVQGPTLLGWTELHDDGFQWPREARHLGSSLVAVPLALLKSRPGSTVAIPSSLIPVRTRSTIFDSRRGRWSQVQLSSAHAILQFELPRQVLPLQVTEAELTIKLDAPKRPVTISYNGRPQHEYDGPVGVQRLALDPAQLPQPVRSGVVEVTLQVQGPADDSKATPWSLDYIHLSVRGVVSSAVKGGESSE